MAKYEVQIERSGYCRGIATYLVEADSKEDAADNYWKGNEIGFDIIRDDTEAEGTVSIELVQDEQVQK